MTPYTRWLCFSFALGAVAPVGAAPNSTTPDYRVERSFGKDEIRSMPRTIAMDAEDKLHVLLSDGSVLVFDTEGRKIGGFRAELGGPATAMAPGRGGVYLLCPQEKTVERESKGRRRSVKEASGVKCVAFSPTGEKQAEWDLPEVVSATDAHFIGDLLAVADYKKAQIVTFDLSSPQPKVVKKLNDGFRLCCGIFDFYPAADGKSMLVANLGAFKVQTYTGSRKSHDFGARGDKPEEFHGCCNPVNVADIGGDFVVAVEKDPTRVRVCDRRGKRPKPIEGLGELVKGCSTIPIAVDRRNALYLASAAGRCIVKCVTGSAPTPTPSPPSPPPAPVVAKYTELSGIRAWRDDSGQIIEGKLVSFDDEAGKPARPPVLVRGGQVRILVNNRVGELPVEVLCEEDREYIQHLQDDLAARYSNKIPSP